MTWRAVVLIALMLFALATAKARATDCPGNPDAIGTSRVLTIDPRQFPRIGTVQYQHSVPLEDREVVLTFDDGPLPPYSTRILDVLAENCVKANYFLVGRMARGYPALARRIRAEGHTIGTHSENHLLGFDQAPMDTVQYEIEQGIISVGSALGDPKAVTPFFRIPGFLRRKQVEAYLQSRGLATWSADVVADDWRHINASEVVRRAITRLEERGKGVLLLHDIQPATALALPELLRELKARGFRIVQVVPNRAEMAVPVASIALPPTPEQKEPATSVSAPPPAPVLAAIVPRRIEPERPHPIDAEPVLLRRGRPSQAKSEQANPEPPQVDAIREEPQPAPEQTEPVRRIPPVVEARAMPAPVATPFLTAGAADSMARGEVPFEPVRPFTSNARPSRGVSTLDKLAQ